MISAITFKGLILILFITISLAQNCCDTASIQVKGLGVNRIKPDIAKLSAYLITIDTTAQKAIKKMKQKLDKIITTDLFYLINDYDFQTSSMGIYPNYNTTNNTKVKTGYTVYVYLTVIIRDIEFYDTLIARVIEILMSEVQYISKIQFQTEDSSGGKVTALNNVLNDAYKDALAKADQYAKIVGRRLGKIIFMQQKLMNDYPQDQYGGKYTQADYSNTDEPNLYGQTPIIPVGTVTLAAEVTVSWQLD